MPKGSEKLVSARKDEIVNACRKLYETMNFKEITLKEIGNETSFTRTSIYNYFQTKEEIFLELLRREYEMWIEDLQLLLDTHETLAKDEFAKELAATVGKRELMLKLMSMNHYDLESNCRHECLVEFKKAYGASIRMVTMCLEKFLKQNSIAEIQKFIYVFFPFMFGIYPYTVVNEKQRAAMEEAGVNYVFMTIYEITYQCVAGLLNVE